MAERILANGRAVPELDSPIDLVVHTKAPEKYILVDLETQQVYRGRGDSVLKGRDWDNVSADYHFSLIRKDF